MASRCKKLTALDLSGCHGIGASGVQAVVSHCHKLKTLSLSGCNKLGDDSCLVLAHANQLELLNLGGCARVINGTGAVVVVCHEKVNGGAPRWVGGSR